MDRVEMLSCNFHDVDASNTVPYVMINIGLDRGAVVPYVVTTTGEYYDFNLYSGIGFPGEVGAGLSALSEEERQYLLGDDQQDGRDRLLQRVRKALSKEIQQAEDRIAHLWFDSRTTADER